MKFKHDDALERDLPERTPAKYDDLDTVTCEVRVTRVFQAVEHYRTTLPEAGIEVDDRYFALGLTPEDLDCEHEVTRSPDRFGDARCSRCQGHLWSMAWVADGVFGDGTLTWARGMLASHTERLPRLRLV